MMKRFEVRHRLVKSNRILYSKKKQKGDKWAADANDLRDRWLLRLLQIGPIARIYTIEYGGSYKIVIVQSTCQLDKTQDEILKSFGRKEPIFFGSQDVIRWIEELILQQYELQRIVIAGSGGPRGPNILSSMALLARTYRNQRRWCSMHRRLRKYQSKQMMAYITANSGKPNSLDAVV